MIGCIRFCIIMPQEPNTVGLIFNIASDATMEEAVSALEAAKISVDAPLLELGMILGTGRLSQLKELREMPVFHSVNVDSPVQIAPPDSPTQ